MIALAALLAAQAAVPARPVTLEAFWAHLHAWNGREVAVRGWTHGCGAIRPDLQGPQARCYITSGDAWRGGRGRLRLDGFPRHGGGDMVAQVVVRGTVEEDVCPSDAVCLDGESGLRVSAVEFVGKARR